MYGWRAPCGRSAAETELGGPTSSPANTAKRHQFIVDALADRDPDAAIEAVHRHFDEVRKRVKAGRYGAPGPSVDGQLR